MPRRIKKFSTYSLLTDMEINSLTLNQKLYNKKDNLYAWFRFENDISVQGNALDSGGESLDLLSGGTNRPTFLNSAPSSKPTVSGFAKKSYGFVSGSASMLKAAASDSFNFKKIDGASPSNAFTISAWVNFDDLTGSDNQFVVAKYNPGVINEQQYSLEVDPDGAGRGSFLFKIFNGADRRLQLQATDLKVRPGEWFHVVATFSGTVADGAPADSGIKIYINGTPTTESSTFAGASGAFTFIPDGAAPFSVGNHYNNPTDTDFFGQISEVAVWRTELTLDDVQVLYNFKDTVAYRFSSGFVNLPPRVLLRQQDNATGSYPTVMRVGDRDRTGAYNRSFEDNYTINFGRKIKDNFELKNREGGGILGFSKDIDTSKWTHSSGMEIRQELLVRDSGTTSGDTAIVFSGKGTGGVRHLQTKNKIKNPRVKIDLIVGPYQETQTVLKFGLGLASGTATDVLKIQASTGGSSWTDIKTIQNNVTSILSDSFVRDFRPASFIERKRVQVDLHPTDFPFGSDSFYLRIAQESVSAADDAVWAIGKIEIDYHNEENISYPLMIDVDTFVGQKIVSASVTAPHLEPTLKGPGRSLAGISDVHLSFTPGEGMSAFSDNSHFFNDTNQFYNQGTDPNILPGFSSPVSNKTIIEVDLSPSEQTTFGMTSRGTQDSSGLSNSPYLETDPTVKQQLMVYWNNDLRRWEKISQGISANAAFQIGPEGSPLSNMIHSGALGFSGIGMVSTGSGPTLSEQTVVNQDALLSFVRPTSAFGFPFEGKYEATSSQTIKAKDIGITKPFLLEKCSITFDSKFEFASSFVDSGSRGYSLLGGYPSGSSLPSFKTTAVNQKVFIPTFFILNQGKDLLDVNVEYGIESSGVISTRKRSVTIPDSAVHLSTAADETSITSVENSREVITYGQMSMFVSGVANTSNTGVTTVYADVNTQFDIEKIMSNGLSRDKNINILSLTGQSSYDSSGLTGGTQLNPVTGTFNIDFPCRITSKIENTSTLGLAVTASSSTNKTLGTLLLGNTLGGRSDGGLESSSRSLVNGYGSFKTGQPYFQFSHNNSSPPFKLTPPAGDSIDKLSPYVILPEDDIVFGWQYPVASNLLFNSPGKSDVFLNSMSLYGNSKIRLIGSLIKNKKEHHEGLNQNLSSDAIHEIIGAETPIDQFQVSKQGANKGNFYDTGVTSTGASTPVARIGSETFSKLTTLVSNAGKASGKITISTFGLGLYPGMTDGETITIELLDNSGGDDTITLKAKTSPGAADEFALFGDATVYYQAVFTLAALRLKIISNSDLTSDDVIITSNDFGSAGFTSTLEIFQPVGGTVGNKTISQSATGTDLRPLLSSFSGGEDGKITRGNSFARSVQLTDAVRIYTDSTGSISAFTRGSSFGLFQSIGGVFPKYYFDSKKYGNFSDFMDQGKDSKFSQFVGKSLRDFKGSALQSPVEIKFVSGANESTIGIRRFQGAPPVFSENITTTSALTSSFELPV